MGGRKMIAILNTSLKGDDALIGIGNLTIRILLIQSNTAIIGSHTCTRLNVSALLVNLRRRVIGAGGCGRSQRSVRIVPTAHERSVAVSGCTGTTFRCSALTGSASLPGALSEHLLASCVRGIQASLAGLSLVKMGRLH